ncbi:MAG: hypothetical protein ACRET5_19240 [Steroidobacteraceae bacterium]
MVALLSWLGLSLCYLAFAGSLSAAEVTAAVLTGAFATILSVGLRAKGERRLPLRGQWLTVLSRLSLQLVRDTGWVGATLVRTVFRARGHRGRVVLDREWAGCPVGAQMGHRAAAALLASLTPESIALETGNETIPTHRLSGASEPRRRRRRTR